MRRNLLSLAVVIAALSVTLVAPVRAATKSVQVQDDVFVPPKIAVKPGDSVTWTNPGGPTSANNHNVDFDQGQFTDPPSPVIGPWVATHMFTTTGVYGYHCHEHGAPGGLGNVGMSGVVYVNDLGDVPPTATLSVSPNPAQTGQTVDFNATSSSDPDGTIAKYEWDFGDGSSVETNTSATSMTYTTPGTRTVKVRVTDDKGMTDEKSTSLQIDAAPPPPPSGGGSPVAPPNLAGPAPLADMTGPSVSGYALTNKVFQAGKASTPTTGNAARKKAATGTTFKYKLSEAATVKIDLQQLLAGRRKGKACVKPSAKLKKAKKCIRALSQGTLTRTSHVGANTVAFTGRVGGRKLKPGSYQAVLTATDAARNHSARKTVGFKVVRG